MRCSSGRRSRRVGGEAGDAAASAHAPDDADADSPALGLRGLAICTPFADGVAPGSLATPSIRALLPGDETIVMLGRGHP